MLGNKLLDTVIMGLSTLAALACVGVFVYTETVYQKPLIDGAPEEVALLEDNKARLIPKPLTFEKVVVNIRSHRVTRLRYLETHIDLIPLKNKYLQPLEKKKSQILDKIIKVTGEMSADELNSISGKILLESRIKKQIAELMGGPAVKEIYFSKFVIQ